MNKAVIFDLDGTLWPATEIALPAFKLVFAELGLVEPSDEALALALGYPLAEIWEMLLPSDKLHLASQADALMEKAEFHLLEGGQARTFPKVKETLQALRSKGYMTFICSNCQSAYLEFTPQALGITHLFDRKYCAGMYKGLSKAEIVAIIKAEHNISSGFMVGDRFHDIEAGKANNLRTIGCSFGTGQPSELTGADYVIDAFATLTQIIV